jgi:tubulin-specific chaperone C
MPESDDAEDVSISRVLRDVSLARLHGCTIEIHDVSAAVRAVDLVDCRVYVGPVSGSIHVTNCSGCIIHAAARQVRLHSCRQCTVQVFAGSPPIIEKCERVSFAPYGLQYKLLDVHMRRAGLTGATNEWSKVQDFSWLRAGPSPNWTLLDAVARSPGVELTSTIQQTP